MYPLVRSGIISEDAYLTCHSVTGYSGGGKSMIAQYESDEPETLLSAPRQYGIKQTHKHLPEMTKISGIKNAPVFSPIVSDFYSGMEVTVPLFSSWLCDGKTAEDIKQAYHKLYTGPVVFYKEEADEAGFLSTAAYTGCDCMEISVHGSGERIILVAGYDNLGKGASGAAVECLNIVLNEEKTKTLVI